MMPAFRALLVAMMVVLSGYTLVVGIRHGWNLLPVFFGDLSSLSWAGQFNLDFMCLLALSGLWLAWRHHFSAGGLLLGVCGFFGGTAVLAPYLLLASLKARGDMRTLLLGPLRAAA